MNRPHCRPFILNKCKLLNSQNEQKYDRHARMSRIFLIFSALLASATFNRPALVFADSAMMQNFEQDGLVHSNPEILESDIGEIEFLTSPNSPVHHLIRIPFKTSLGTGFASRDLANKLIFFPLSEAEKTNTAAFLEITRSPNGNTVDIDMVWVHPSLRGRGISNFLYQELARRIPAHSKLIGTLDQSNLEIFCQELSRMLGIDRCSYIELHRSRNRITKEMETLAVQATPAFKSRSKIGHHLVEIECDFSEPNDLSVTLTTRGL